MFKLSILSSMGLIIEKSKFTIEKGEIIHSRLSEV